MPHGSISPGVYVEELPSGVRSIAALPTAVTAFVGPTSTGPTSRPARCRSWAEFEHTFGAPFGDAELASSVRAFFDHGGRTAVVSSVATGTRSDADAYVAAIRRLARTDDAIDLVVIPPPTASSDVHPSVWTAAESWCREHRAVVLVDPPVTWTAASDAVAHAGLEGIRSPHTAWYFPRVIMSDPVRGGPARSMAPSGAVAGVIARNDARRGVWKAPAGLEANLTLGTRPEHELSSTEIGSLTRTGINAIRFVRGAGTVLWGARTGDDKAPASPWTYLPVRRLASHLTVSLERGLSWTVVEPNDAPLWASIRHSVESFLNDRFRAGAFAGSTATEAYFVRCDRSTTTPADIAAGVARVLIGFAPQKPAEFVILRVATATAT